MTLNVPSIAPSTVPRAAKFADRYNDYVLNVRPQLQVVSPGDRLESWKEIAGYLNRSVRTVRRWEGQEGLPVHRLQHESRGSIYAFKSELEAWRESRKQLMEVEPPEPQPVVKLGGLRRLWWIAAAALLIVVSAGAYWTLRPSRAAPGYTTNAEALRAFQKAQYGANPGRDQIQAGIKYFQEAIRLDPGFAAAWAGLATAHISLTWFGEVPARETMGQAKIEAAKALALGGSFSSPWRVLAFTSHYLDWNQGVAESQFRKSMELSPHDRAAPSWFAEFLLDMGRFDEALQYAKQAKDNDPRWLEPMTVTGNIHAFAGHLDLAIAEYRQALEIEPGHGLSNHFLGRAYLGQGQFAKAIEQLRRSNELLGGVPFSKADLGYALAIGGMRAEAQRMLVEMNRQRETGYFPAFGIAEVELGLGNVDAALVWLERASEERNLGFYLPWNDPVYRALRGETRFKALMQRVVDPSKQDVRSGA